MAWAHATITPCPYKAVLGWTGVKDRVSFKDAEKGQAMAQSLCAASFSPGVGTWILVAVSIEEWENASWWLLYLISSQASVRWTFLGWSSWKQERQSAMPTASSPLCCCRLDPDIKSGGRQLHCFFIPLDATQCFADHQKYVGTTEGAAGSEQARPISVLCWGTWLSGQWIWCYSSNTRKQTYGDIYM